MLTQGPSPRLYHDAVGGRWQFQLFDAIQG
jgi:hypothetical protein